MSKRRKKSKSEQDANGLEKQIEKAAKGLVYISENDADVLLFAGDKADDVTKENLLTQTNNPPDAPVEERDFDEFFNRLTAMQDWFGDEKKATAAKFAALRDLLKSNLKDLKVFKVGSVQIDIYVVGLDSDGKLIGIKTKAVET